MAEIKKGIDDFVSGFHIEELANHLSYLIKEYYQNQIVAHTEARPDLGVDWWTAEYLADHIEEIANKLLEECDNLRAYANSGERRPLEDWQNAFNKSTKKSKVKKSADLDDAITELEQYKEDFFYEGDYDAHSLLDDALNSLYEGDLFNAEKKMDMFLDRHSDPDAQRILQMIMNLKSEDYYASTKKSKINKYVDGSDAYHRMWQKYVPLQGEADSVFGEVLRCASRVIYRYYNDGDMYSIGYGRDTVSPALQYLKRQNQYPEIRSIAEELARFVKDNHWELKNTSGLDNQYEQYLDRLMQELNLMCEYKDREDNASTAYNSDSEEFEDWSYYASTKKSIPKANMSFEDNVNKMRTHNYARTGNINTVMKKRD